MKAVTYITENTIMKFLYNPKKPLLEGFVKEGLSFNSGAYKDYGKYVRFLKVPIRDNVSELYMQGYPWETQKGCKDRPIGYIDSAAEFERVAVIIDSSKIWPMVGSSSIEAFSGNLPGAAKHSLAQQLLAQLLAGISEKGPRGIQGR